MTPSSSRNNEARTVRIRPVHIIFLELDSICVELIKTLLRIGGHGGKFDFPKASVSQSFRSSAEVLPVFALMLSRCAWNVIALASPQRLKVGTKGWNHRNEFATLTWRYGAFSRICLTGRSTNDARRDSRYIVHVGVPSVGYRRKSLASAPASATRIRCPLRRSTDVA